MKQEEKTSGFSKKLLDKQSEVAEKLDAITSDPVVLARAERFHRKVTRLSPAELLRQLERINVFSEQLEKAADPHLQDLK